MTFEHIFTGLLVGIIVVALILSPEVSNESTKSNEPEIIKTDLGIQMGNRIYPIVIIEEPNFINTTFEPSITLEDLNKSKEDQEP